MLAELRNGSPRHEDGVQPVRGRRAARGLADSGTRWCRGAFAALLLSGLLAPGAEAQAPARDQQAVEQSFEALLAAADSPRPPPLRLPGVSAGGGAGQVQVSLGRFEELVDTGRRRQEQRELRGEPAISYRSAHYTGSAVPGALELTLQLQLRLGRPDIYKTVPLVGDDVVVVEAHNGSERLALAREGGFHVWVTPDSGDFSLRLRLLVPARGPRGSSEYDFGVVRTPVTRLSCRFPGSGLQPRLDGAVQSDLRDEDGATVLDAVLEPTLRVHLLGLRDLGGEDEQPARLYAESLNLLSIGDGTLDLFCVLRYTILYAGAKRFRIQLPPGLRVVSADGEGAFRYELQPTDAGPLLLGETAFPIRNHYEISLHLRRPLKDSGEELDVRLPRTLDVQREAGWLGVEVPGKLLLGELQREQVRAVDLRQLPAEVVRNAVSPILFAYRFHDPALGLRLQTQRLPEQAVHSGSVDRLRAFSLLSPEGTLLTELRITLRNRLRHGLALSLPDGSEVRSTLLDGQPVKASRDEQGRLLLPLKRSAGSSSLQPFELLVVTEQQLGPVGLLGSLDLELPAPDLPVSSAEWGLYLPAHTRWADPAGDVHPQTRVGSATWHAPAPVAGAVGPQTPSADPGGAPASSAEASAEAGAMPVRIQLPRAGVRLDSERYWLAANEPLRVELSYLRGWLRYPLLLLVGLLGALGMILVLAQSPARWLGWPLAAAALATLGTFAGGGTATLVALGGAGVGAHRRGWLVALPTALFDWAKAAWVAWRKPTAVAQAESGETTEAAGTAEPAAPAGGRPAAAGAGFGRALARVAVTWGVVLMGVMVLHAAWRVARLVVG